MESGSGGGRGEATRNIYYSDRRLPPGHDPGAASGEAPNGRQRGSRPCNILVEGRGGDRPRHEVREVRISTIEMNIARRRPDPARRTSERAEARRSRPRLRPRKTGCSCRDHVAHGAHGVTRPPWARDQGSPRHGDHGRHSGHGDEDGDAPAVITAITAPTAAHAPRARDESLLSHDGHGRHGGHGGHGASRAAPDDHGGHDGLVGAVTAGQATRRRRVTARARRSRRSRREPASQRIGDPKRGWPG